MTSEMRLYDPTGKRLYLNRDERAAFLLAASKYDPVPRAFAETLCYSGCRISEGLQITPERCDLIDSKLVFQTLKRRRSDTYRAVPVPPEFMDSLDRTFNLRKAQSRKAARSTKLFPWSRQHAWLIVKKIMTEAGIADGPHRSPKGLRHAYGIHAISAGVPVTTVQKWMGHAQLSTTAIYVDFVGPEESALAERMWV